MPHISHEELMAALARARLQVDVGGRYTHYKDSEKVYEVVDLAILEADERVAVLYRIANGATSQLTWVRPLESFLETVEHEGEKVLRFARVG